MKRAILFLVLLSACGQPTPVDPVVVTAPAGTENSEMLIAWVNSLQAQVNALESRLLDMEVALEEKEPCHPHKKDQ